MPPTTLNTGVSVTLDANGNGTVTLGPNTGPPIWHVTYVAVFTTRRGQAPVPQFVLYVGPAVPNNQRGLSYDGSFDEADVDIYLPRNEVLTGVWTGGQSGDVATMSIYGERLMQ